MNKDTIKLPQGFDEWQLTNPTPQEQVDYFNKYPNIRLPIKQWDTFYCVSIEHKGFHCSSCKSDEEYNNYTPNFDDRCCCLSETNRE